MASGPRVGGFAQFAAPRIWKFAGLWLGVPVLDMADAPEVQVDLTDLDHRALADLPEVAVVAVSSRASV